MLDHGAIYSVQDELRDGRRWVVLTYHGTPCQSKSFPLSQFGHQRAEALRQQFLETIEKYREHYRRQARARA